LRDEARTALAARTNGADEMIERLARHASFLHDEHVPPVGPIATALAAMKETRAEERLIEQLFDPALPQHDLLDTMKAIAALATVDHVADMQRYVLLYRSGASGNAALVEGLSSFCGAIVRLKGGRGRAWVQQLAGDALTDPDVTVALRRLLAAESVAASK
jgi:outer membrane protein assembly factor BamB